jgi:tight adherence protein B
MDPLVIVISILVLLTIFTLALAFFGRKDLSADKNMKKRLQAFQGEGEVGATPGSTEEDAEGTALKQRSYSGIPILSNFFKNLKGSEAVALQLERAGIPLRVGEYYMIRWSIAGIFFAAPFLFGVELFNLAVGVLLAIVGYWLPGQWVSNKRRKRTEAMNAQLVDLLGMVSNSLKSGYGMMQSFEFAGRQLPDPLGQEVRRMLREATLGLTAEQALHSLGARVDSKDMDMVITAINIQRSVGGNLAEILDNVAYTMRERERIRGEINTLTSQQKLTGVVIGGLPIFMFLIFMVINPDYMSLLFTTMAGRAIILVATVLEVMGYFTIKRIIAIDV